MSPRDFGLLAFICLIWGANLPMTRWVAADVPPLFIAALRFGGTALCLIPWLRPMPAHLGRVLAAGLCMGGLQFGLQYAGVAMAPASSAAIVAQLGLPFTVLLSATVLKEKVGPRRVAGLLLAISGVVLVAYDPHKVGISAGLLLVMASAFSVGIGTILMKRLSGVGALELQAWAGWCSFGPLVIASFLLEEGQWQGLAAAGPAKWTAILYSVLLASIAGQAVFFKVVRRNDVSLITPMTLMTPLWAVLIGVSVLGEELGARAMAGTAIALTGVALGAWMKPSGRCVTSD